MTDPKKVSRIDARKEARLDQNKRKNEIVDLTEEKNDQVYFSLEMKALAAAAGLKPSSCDATKDEVLKKLLSVGNEVANKRRNVKVETESDSNILSSPLSNRCTSSSSFLSMSSSKKNEEKNV